MLLTWTAAKHLWEMPWVMSVCICISRYQHAEGLCQNLFLWSLHNEQERSVHMSPVWKVILVCSRDKNIVEIRVSSEIFYDTLNAS